MSDTSLPQFFWDDEVTPSGCSGPDWIWHGLLARRTTTLLTGHGKLTGKTTLLSILLSRRAAGGQLAGLSVNPGKTIIVSEEPRSLWDDRIRKYNFGGNVCLIRQPFLTVPSPGQWQVGLAARGSSAFLGHVDISIEMRQPGGDPLTRRRHLHALSRFAETPRRLVLELNADATDYMQVVETAPDEFEGYFQAFRMVLETVARQLDIGRKIKPKPALLGAMKAAVVDRKGAYGRVQV